MKIYGVNHFTYNDVFKVLNSASEAGLDEKSKSQILKSKSNVESIVNSGVTVYGINTGFGPLCDTKISKEETRKLQENLLISHAVGVGNPISKEISRSEERRVGKECRY